MNDAWTAAAAVESPMKTNTDNFTCTLVEQMNSFLNTAQWTDIVFDLMFHVLKIFLSTLSTAYLFRKSVM